jgi:hypothetical protein
MMDMPESAVQPPPPTAGVQVERPAVATEPELTLVAHSNVLYWWPAWVVGYLAALVTYAYGQVVQMPPDAPTVLHPSNNPGLLFIAVIGLLVIFTNTRLRGIYSVTTGAILAFFIVLFAWLDWWNEILRWIPTLSAKANLGFYLVFSTMMLIIWLFGVLFFDRLTYWRIRPGQVIEERLIGGSAHAYDATNLSFEKRGQDFFRHILLGLGAVDIRLVGDGRQAVRIDIPNIVLVNRKLRALEQLLVVKPDQVQ